MSLLSRRLRIPNGTRDSQLLRLFEPGKQYGDKKSRWEPCGIHIHVSELGKVAVFFALVFSPTPQAFMRHQ